MKTKYEKIQLKENKIQYNWGDYQRLQFQNGIELWKCPPEGIFLVTDRESHLGNFFQKLSEAQENFLTLSSEELI